MDSGFVDAGDLSWWTSKVERRGSECFNPTVGRWASHVLQELVALDKASLEARSLEALAETLGVPYKYLTRSIATLTRCGVVVATLHPIPVLVIQHSVFSKRKGTAQVVRTALSKKAKLDIFSRDGYVCAHCQLEFTYSHLHVDHIVPISLLGADEPGNMVSMCGRCNGIKSDKFIPTYVNQYRSVEVGGPIQLRFISGCFWPVINGAVQQQKRSVR